MSTVQQGGATPARKGRSKSSLAILERAYRGSLEEQYGHILWLSRIMKAMGAPTAVLLKGDTVNFARSGQPRQALTLGDLQVTGLSHHESGVTALLEAAVPVYAWQADLARRHLAPTDLVAGVTVITPADLPALMGRYDCVWYW